jgi:hypothetical protein
MNIIAMLVDDKADDLLDRLKNLLPRYLTNSGKK